MAVSRSTISPSSASRIAESQPDVVREVYRVLKESRAAAALPTGDDDPVRFGVGAQRQSLEQMVAYAHQQGLIARRFTAEELFADAVRILRTAAE
jgi:4,5-dihydroxyphthalate decarboxylase